MAAFVEVSNKSLTACNVTPTGDAGLAINNNFTSIDALFNVILGQNVLRPRGGWATATAYNAGDFVLQSSVFYQCILAHTSAGGNTPPNATYWSPLANPSLFDAAGSAAAAQSAAEAASVPLSGGTMTGDLNMGVHHINFQNTISGISSNSGGTININAALNVGTNDSVYTVASTFDDGSGNMMVGNNLYVPGTITGSATLTNVKGIQISGSSVIANGLIGSVEIPCNCTVTKWAVISTNGTSGSISFDVQQSAFGSALYTNTTVNSIVGNGSGGVYPNLTSQTTNSSSTLTHWTTSLTGGNYLVFVVNDTPSSLMNVRLELTLTPR